MSDDEPFPDDASSDDYQPESDLANSDTESGLSDDEPLQKKKKLDQEEKTFDTRKRFFVNHPALAGPSHYRGKLYKSSN